MKKSPQKVAYLSRMSFCCPTAQMAEFMFPNVAYRATVYRTGPTSMVSTSMNSTSTNFSVIGIKFVLVEFVISKFILVEFSLCTTQLKAGSEKIVY